MSFRARVLSVIGVLIAAFGIQLVVTNTAAQASVSNCGIAVCVWDSGNFSGSPMYYWTLPPNGCTNLQGSINDRTAAVRNNRGWVATFYTDANCSGSTVVTVSAFGSVGEYRNCNNTQYDGNGWWNQSASGCTVFPNNRRISSFWFSL